MEPSLFRTRGQGTRAAAAFFDLFERPVTAAEAVRHGGATAIEALRADGLGSTEGMRHLPGRAAAAETRRERYLTSMRKLRRARRVARWLSRLPSVRMIAVCNSLALANAGEESDIDLFVVTAPGTIWATRFVAVSALAALRLRPDARTHKDRVCMSFFVTEDGLDLRRVALEDDPYLRHWLLSLVPLYDAGGAMASLYARNRWAVGDAAPPKRSRRFSVAARRAGALARGVVRMLRACEASSRRLQERMFPGAIRAIVNADTRVVADDKMLKFHVDDRREEFARRFAERMNDYTSEIASSQAPRNDSVYVA